MMGDAMTTPRLGQPAGFALPAEIRGAIVERLADLYGADRADRVAEALEAVAGRLHAARPDLAARPRTLPQDPVLITYGDQVTAPGVTPLAALDRWVTERLSDALGTVHLLPFFPYSSDDGFSVIDYRQIDPRLGTWSDIRAMGERVTLMFDAVINHASAQGPWFEAFKAGQAPYSRYFRVVEAGEDLSQVTRPRTTPLTHEVSTADGSKRVWTTFSDDQVDLDFANPDLLVEIADVLLGYVAHGARLIRLDAVCFLWKIGGSTCIHLPGTHRIIQIYRLLMDAVAPSVLFVTETNVPHEENVGYFGDGHTEAQMVYNFALPPLLLDAVHREDAERLSDWAADLSVPSADCCFFNITATHDGIGVRGAQGRMTPAEVLGLAEAIRQRGGLVSNRRLPDGSDSPYELNITLFDALLPPGADPAGTEALDRYLTAQAVALSLAGVPAIYVHNLFGSRSDHAALTGVDATQTEFKRLVNRHKFTWAELDGLLADPGGREARIFARYTRLLQLWRQEPAFAPTSPQAVLRLHPGVLAIRRGPEGAGDVICLHNLSGQPAELMLPDAGARTDIVTGESVPAGSLVLPAWSMRWLRRPIP